MTGADGRSDDAVEERPDGLLDAVPLWTGALASVAVFLFAVQLLGAATEGAAPLLERVLGRTVVDGSSALGLSWLATYGLTNGSVVAALGLSLLDAELLSPPETFLVIAGSRLGGAAIVLVVGVLDYLQRRDARTLREGTSLGTLTFLVTFTVYVPVTVLGVAALSAFQSDLLAATTGLRGLGQSPSYLDPVMATITRTLGPGPSFGLALAVLFGSLWLFDEVLEHVRTETVRTHLFRHVRRKWTAFAVGLLLTGVTTSVAFSLGVIVPLYNREFVRREEVVPYVLGANVGTLLDTLVVAFVLDSTVGVALVSLVMGLATLVTLVALAAYAPYTALVDAGQDRLLDDRRYLVAFGVLLVAVPLALLVLPHR